MDDTAVTALNAIVTGYARESVTDADLTNMQHFMNSVATVTADTFQHREDGVFALLTTTMLMMASPEEISEGGVHDREDLGNAIRECADFFQSHATLEATN